MPRNQKTISTWLLYFYLFTLAIDLIAMYFLPNEIRFISKSILMPLLLVFYLLRTQSVPALKHFVTAALIFSWLGDIALLFQGPDPLYFLIGLSCFLIAHLFYIYFFHRIRTAEMVKGRWLIVVVVVIYYFIFTSVQLPYLGEMKIAVLIYGLVISFMLVLALHLLFIKNKSAGMLMAVGAILFVISDSILAIDMFYQPFELAGLLIMLTYGFAQLCIVLGASRYLTDRMY